MARALISDDLFESLELHPHTVHCIHSHGVLCSHSERALGTHSYAASHSRHRA